MGLDPFALYNLTNHQFDLSELVKECNSRCPRDDYVHFQPSPNIKSLSELINFHLNTTAQQNFEPGWFIVVIDEEWKDNGVFIVAVDDGEGKPDGFMIRAAESGLSLTEWKPITGVLPPLTATQWEEEFDKYKLTPEFKL